MACTAAVVHAGEQPCPTPLSTGAAAGEDPFANSDAVKARFAEGLGRFADQGQVVSPVELADQASQRKTCVLETLSDPQKKLSAEAVYGQARRSVVVLGAIYKCPKCHKWHTSTATGFVIRKDGAIVTNAHVLASFNNMKAVGAMTCDGRIFPVKSVLAADPIVDLAVVKVEADNLTPLPLAPQVAVGATVYCLSHPHLDDQGKRTCFYAFTQGIVCGKPQLRAKDGGPLDVLAVTADYAAGSSGGPILNEHGAAVGVVSQAIPVYHDPRDKQVQMVWKLARPASSLLKLLEEPKLTPPAEPPVK